MSVTAYLLHSSDRSRKRRLGASWVQMGNVRLAFLSETLASGGGKPQSSALSGTGQCVDIVGVTCAQPQQASGISNVGFDGSGPPLPTSPTISMRYETLCRLKGVPRSFARVTVSLTLRVPCPTRRSKPLSERIALPPNALGGGGRQSVVHFRRRPPVRDAQQVSGARTIL